MKSEVFTALRIMTNEPNDAKSQMIIEDAKQMIYVFMILKYI